MGFFSMLLGTRSTKVREEATRLGITVSEVTRDLPHFSRDGKTVVLTPASCVRYSIPRVAPRPRTTWTLLQRTKAQGSTLPNDYLLTSSAPMPAGLDALLRQTAEEYAEELFEFEGIDIEVAVYWEEWGGPEKARTLHDLLVRMASW